MKVRAMARNVFDFTLYKSRVNIWEVLAPYFNMLCKTPVSCNMHPVHNLNSVRCATIHIECGICMLEKRAYQEKIQGTARGSPVSEVMANLVREDNECRVSPTVHRKATQTDQYLCIHSHHSASTNEQL